MHIVEVNVNLFHRVHKTELSNNLQSLHHLVQSVDNRPFIITWTVPI